MMARANSARRGASLVEALVALAIIGLAVAGVSETLRVAARTTESARSEAHAASLLREIMNSGVAGAGERATHSSGAMRWRLERRVVSSARLAGAASRWEAVEGEVEWMDRARPRHLGATRIEIVGAEPATR